MEISTSTPTFELKEITAVGPRLEEIITEDGILCLILSSLSLEEAVRTSVLSSRWRYIWTHLTKFDFNVITVLAHTLRDPNLGGMEAYRICKGKRAKLKFIRSVNSVLRRHQGTRVDEFAVRFFLDKRHSYHIDAWVRFALASKTRVLRLHLYKPLTISQIKPYEFQCQLLGSSPFVDTLTLIFCSFKLPYDFDCFRNLKHLFLCQVDVTEEDFNCILSNCSSTLLKLGVMCIPQWESLRVPQSSSKLQVLLVTNCDRLRKIEIMAVNVTKLSYLGAPIELGFAQSSKLNDADIHFVTGGILHNLYFYLTKLSRCLPNLESLSFTITDVSKMADLPKTSSRFIHLTRLNLKWEADVEMSLLHIITLLEVAPYLQKLKLHFSGRVLEQPPETPSKFREMLCKHRHSGLKTIHVSGFYFDMPQLEVAAYLLNSATGLESMMIEIECSDNCFVSEEIQERGSKILSQQVPENVRLVIL